MFFALRFKSFIELCLFIAYQKCFNTHCIATKKRVPWALVQASLLFVKYSVQGTSEDEESNSIYDARNDVEWIIKRASNYGLHFLFCFDQGRDFINLRLDENAFRHKILFPMSKDESISIMGSRKANEIGDGTCIYSNGKETRLFSRMIGERELTDSKTLYRRATFEDLNGLQIDFNNLNTLSGQQFNFCGFMSTSPDARLPNYVSHGNLVFEFEAPAGTSALDLSSLMYNEVIFDSPLCQINHAERRGNDIYIRASIK